MVALRWPRRLKMPWAKEHLFSCYIRGSGSTGFWCGRRPSASNVSFNMGTPFSWCATRTVACSGLFPVEASPEEKPPRMRSGGRCAKRLDCSCWRFTTSVTSKRSSTINETTWQYLQAFQWIVALQLTPLKFLKRDGFSRSTFPRLAQLRRASWQCGGGSMAQRGSRQHEGSPLRHRITSTPGRDCN